MRSHQRDFDIVNNQQAHEALIRKVLDESGGGSSTGVAVVHTWSPLDEEVVLKEITEFNGTSEIVRNGITPTNESTIQVKVVDYDSNEHLSENFILDQVITPANIEEAAQAVMDDLSYIDGTVSVTGDTWTGAASDDALFTFTASGVNSVYLTDPVTADGMGVANFQLTEGTAGANGFYMDLSTIPYGGVITQFYGVVIEDLEVDPEDETHVGGYVCHIWPQAIDDTLNFDQLTICTISALLNDGQEDGSWYRPQVAKGISENLSALVAQDQSIPASFTWANGANPVLLGGLVDIVAEYFIPPNPVTTTSTEWDNNGD